MSKKIYKDIEVKVNDKTYWLAYRTKLGIISELRLFEKRPLKEINLEIKRNLTPKFWIKYNILRPVRMIRCKLYYIYHRYILKD